MSIGIYQSFVPCAVVFILCILMPLLHNASPTTTTTMFRGNETDRLALLTIKAKMTDDPMLQVTTSSLNDSLYFCQWHGVSCGHCHQRVTVLNSQSCNLVGSISPFIGNLSFLRPIYLSNNNLYGGIPHEIGLLLSNNLLEQQIPASLSHCSNLRVVDIGYNKLIGKIPVEVGSLSKLVRLHILFNNLTGAIPPSFGNLSALRMGNNILEGSIPSSLGQLTSLTHVVLRGNELSGEIPSSLGSCSSLEHLLLDYNSFEGAIPGSLSYLKGVEALDRSHNNLSGEIPKDLGSIRLLRNLNLSFNDLKGKEKTSLLVLKLIIPTACGVIGIVFLLLGWLVKKRKQCHPSSVFDLMQPYLTISYGQLLKATDGFRSENLIGTGSFGLVYKGILDPSKIAITGRSIREFLG
ncbi:putative receptor-like protein kinase At3g47110 [Cornus florida]|uniref:putative receptor-like protein kinase At3g47110 n=1 Tax=Cornus florida TaxID=4283 RepID=UPI0028A0BAC8|nr:putative receptor-like protein kinase At3g47110 [Cornus florida]